MNKYIKIEIDGNTFPDKTIKKQFMALSHINYIDVDELLLDTAIATRSPVITGFHLSDYWAWLRYGDAFDTSHELKLKNEWKHVDPHQKTILSDELGVGATIHILKKHLGFKDFVDTQYVMSVVMPSKFRLIKKSKMGPSKSPDYIGRNENGDFVALECKGTQNTVAVLKSAMDKGVIQKKNLTATNGKILKLGLVGGLFIPQSNSKEKATILYRDPEWSDFEIMLESESKELILASIIQGGIAKQLALAGLKQASSEVANNELLSPILLSKEAQREIGALKTKKIIYKSSWLEQSAHTRTFSAQINEGRFEQIFSERLSIDRLMTMDKENIDESYKYIHSENSISIVTPEGFTFEINTIEP